MSKAGFEKGDLIVGINGSEFSSAAEMQMSLGMAMMQAARKGVSEAAPSADSAPKVIAVTVLTSIDDGVLNEECGVPGAVEDHVLRLARLTEAAGLDGIVCSAADMHVLKGELRPGFLFVTPGIKGTSTPAGADQKRVFSPGRAIEAGSSLLVVGRAITAAPDRQAAALEVLQDIINAQQTD